MVLKQHSNTYLIKNKLISIDLNAKGKAQSCKPPIGKKKDDGMRIKDIQHVILHRLDLDWTLLGSL